MAKSSRMLVEGVAAVGRELSKAKQRKGGRNRKIVMLSGAAGEHAIIHSSSLADPAMACAREYLLCREHGPRSLRCCGGTAFTAASLGVPPD